MSVCNALNCHIVGARATGLGVDVGTWAVTHMGFGNYYRAWERRKCYEAANKSAPSLDLILMVACPAFERTISNF